MDPRTRMLLEAPVGRTILRLALPNVVVMVVQASIGLIETYFVAKLGLDALAGMALVFPAVHAAADGVRRRDGRRHPVGRRPRAGGGHSDRANELVWYAVAITIALGALTTCGASVRAEALCPDGRPGRFARRGCDLFGAGVRWRDSAVAVQFVRRDHPRHRQHVLPGGRDHGRRGHPYTAVATADLRASGRFRNSVSPAARQRWCCTT